MAEFAHLDDCDLAERARREADLIEGEGRRECGGWCADGVTTALLREVADRLYASPHFGREVPEADQ